MNRTEPMQEALNILLKRYADMMGRVWRKKLTAVMRAAIISLALRYWNLRERLLETGQYEPLSCICKIDRIIFTTKDLELESVLAIDGYRPRKKPQRLWKKNYLFAWRMKGTGSISEVVIEYEPTAPWFAPYQITIIPRDSSGVTPEDLWQLFRVLPGARISLLEVAWDFPADCLMGLEYIRKFGLFGKTWLTPPQTGNPFHCKWGSVGSKIVRVYVKWELWCFRIELELHAAFLREHGIDSPADVAKLSGILVPDHFTFAQIDDGRVLRSLGNRHLGRAKTKDIVEHVNRKKRSSLWRALRYLTQAPAKLKNVRRDCLTPLDEPNRVIREALEKLAAQWSTAPRLGRKP
jgi:hypothetical protein